MCAARHWRRLMCSTINLDAAQIRRRSGRLAILCLRGETQRRPPAGSDGTFPSYLSHAAELSWGSGVGLSGRSNRVSMLRPRVLGIGKQLPSAASTKCLAPHGSCLAPFSARSRSSNQLVTRRERTGVIMLTHDYFYLLATAGAVAIVMLAIFGGLG
jgi:hypothetical protein